MVAHNPMYAHTHQERTTDAVFRIQATSQNPTPQALNTAEQEDKTASIS